MKLKNILQGILIFLILTQLISAISIQIDMKDSFLTGEKVLFGYTFLSDTTKQIEYIVSVDCPDAPLPLLEIKIANLQKEISFSENYVYLSSVDELIKPQTCRAIVSIISPEEISEEKSFEIISIPSFEFDLFSCKDQYCLEKSKVFIEGENIYLNYDSEIFDLDIVANLISPDDSKEQIQLPTSIKAEKIGTYDLKVTASKEGYKTMVKNLQFGVAEGESEIEEINLSEDEIFYGKKIGGDGKNNFWRYLIYFLIILLIVLFVIFFKFVILPMIKKRK